MPARLRQTEPIVPQIVAALRDAITQMRLRPGERLSEAETAARFDVSRQPVREAFIKLSELGLVEIRPSRGTYVLKISVARIADARFVREAIECDIARNAARIATPAQIAGMQALIGAQHAACHAGDYLSFNRQDEAFHRAIADVVQCDYALRVVESARIEIDRVRYLSVPDAAPMSRLIAQHEAILEALSGHDPDRAEAAMRLHLREILRVLPRIAAGHPELFSDTGLPGHASGLLAVE